jgi:hypothetical protein
MGCAGPGVVAVNGLDQGEGGDLGQVVEEFAASGVAAHQPLGQRQVLLNDPGAEFGAVGVAGGKVVALAQQLFGGCRRVDRLAAAG